MRLEGDPLAATWDVLVVGGGHAGCEAALAAHRLGARTALLTLRRDTIASMPCNPAIGGPAKGTLVREVDALGGQMALVTDATRLQIKILNASKGPAVQALRAQSDKTAYSAAMRQVVEGSVVVLECGVTDLEPGPGGDLSGGHRMGGSISGGPRMDGILTVGTTLGPLRTRALVLTTGTFLGGKCFTGMTATAGGRHGEAPAIGLTEALRRLGFQTGRLKTGTPPRVSRASIDFDRLEPAPGDTRPLRFSYLPCPVDRPDIPCHLTYTTAQTHEIIRRNLHHTPMYQGLIEGVGPRYCPSIEDKVVRFADRERHQLFIEPEGIGPDLHDWMYVQGFSTSLPADVQLEMVRSLPGLERAEILRPGYAVEYDFVPATQLYPSLETKLVPGIFCAGQINGTSGYEEAAAQGLAAGINAALRARGEDPIVFERAGSYLGTLIDDLVTKEIREPYRMLTSRSEWRLLLRSDNADLRLTGLGRKLCLVSDERWAVHTARSRAIAEALEWLAATRVGPSDAATAALGEAGDALDAPATLLELLRRPHVAAEAIWKLGGRDPAPQDIMDQVATQLKYDGYLRRQEQEVARMSTMEARQLPADLDYKAIDGLSNEAREKLTRIRPVSVGQASRIGGITPADVSLLLVHLQLRGKARLTATGLADAKRESAKDVREDPGSLLSSL